MKNSQDVAILEIGPKINAICLPSEKDAEMITNLDNKKGIVSGWGTIGYDIGTGARIISIDKLMEASVLIRTNFWCWKKMNFFKE